MARLRSLRGFVRVAPHRCSETLLDCPSEGEVQMRIAIFTEVFLPKTDGITTRLRHTLRCFRDLGQEVIVFAPDTAASIHAGIRVVRIPGLPFPPYPGLRISLPDPRIAWELKKFGPDVVHAVGPACLGIWGIAAARALSIPIVASHHTDLARYAPLHGLGWAKGAIWPILTWAHGHAQVNLAPSRCAYREMRERGIENVGLWRGGVDIEHFHPRKRSEAMRFRLSGGCPDSPILLYAGRLSPEKNLLALKPALAASPELRLALVGDGPARAELEKAFPKDRVTFTGFLHGEDLATAFASADVFAMPSATETLGFVVLEALSSGLPVVAANAGGIPDLVRDGENGILFDPDRPENAAKAIAELIHHEGIRRFYQKQARKSAEACSWTRETEELLDAYFRAIVIHSQRGVLGRIHHALVG
jgi:glycosyltransferase involved in cell wall biosynthesis